MPLSDHVQITVTRIRTAISRAGFGTMLCLDAHRLWEDRYMTYGSLSELEDAGAAGTDTIHRAASTYFQQNPRPRLFAIGRRLTGDSVTVEVDTVANNRTYSLTVGGLVHEITSTAAATAAQIAGQFVAALNGGYEITVVNQGTKTWTVAGLHADEFIAGRSIHVAASTGNDGNYTIVSSAEGGGNTTIVVTEAIPDATADGHIDGYAITAADVATDYLEVEGDVRERCPAGLEFEVLGSTGNNGMYEVDTTSLVSGNTRIFPTTAVANGTGDGGIKSAADGAAATNGVGADISSGDIVLTPDVATEFYTVLGDDYL